jgi:hypothetical protein
MRVLSDILSQAGEDIVSCLRAHPECYSDLLISAQIRDVCKAMDDLRNKLDQPPYVGREDIARNAAKAAGAPTTESCNRCGALIPVGTMEEHYNVHHHGRGIVIAG